MRIGFWEGSDFGVRVGFWGEGRTWCEGRTLGRVGLGIGPRRKGVKMVSFPV